MIERRTREVELLKKRYGKVTHDEGATWVIVHDVPLPPGWSRSTSDVLMTLGAGYPQTAPDNFFVPAGLRLASGGTPGATSANAMQHSGASWDQFSWHANGSWWPAADVENGSNLLTFMGTVEARLREAS